MTRKLRSTTSSKAPAVIAVALLLVIWELASVSGLVPRYMLPSPVDVLKAFFRDLPVLGSNLAVTLQEAFYGLALGVGTGFLFAVAMDTFEVLYRAFYPSFL